MAFSKQMQIEDIYAELGISAHSKSSNIMLGIEDSRKSELAAERNNKRIEKVRMKELEKSNSQRFDLFEREDKSLQFRVKEPGQIECGLPQISVKNDDNDSKSGNKNSQLGGSPPFIYLYISQHARTFIAVYINLFHLVLPPLSLYPPSL